MAPPRIALSGPTRPVRFAVKCFGLTPTPDPCKRVRVFSYLDVTPPDFTEIPPVLVAHPFIAALSARGGARGKVGRFLVGACDLHMFGLLESDPKSKEAAFSGAAVHLRKAAELFLRRVILVERRRPLPRRTVKNLLDEVRGSPTPPTLNGALRPHVVARKLQYIFDVGTVAAHPEISETELRRKQYRRPALDGTIRRALDYFDDVAGAVNWR